jgi:hypothetical protein
VDCTAAALAGAAVLAFSGWLSRLYALPRDLLLLIGAVNLLYGCYSFSLAVRPRRPRHLINGRAQAIVWVRVPRGRSLRKSYLMVNLRVWQHPLKLPPGLTLPRRAAKW